jgi:formylglycine-generating enzyme required for sulfatase activity
MRAYAKAAAEITSIGKRAVIVLGLAAACPTAPVRADEPDRPSNYTETIPGSAVRFEMVGLPGGTFSMGSPAGEKGRGEDEGPRHPVVIRPFWMGRMEVTWEEYDEFRKGGFVSNRTNAEALAKDADAVTRPTPVYPDETRGFGREGRPAIGMSHHGAMEYCYWLSRKTGKSYRLPTEAEWEYTCRAGSDSAYLFGDDPTELGRYAWFGENSDEKTRPVGRKAANPWGLHDMTGNATEWCIDRYAADAYSGFSPDRPTVVPVLLPGAAPYPHVARGGSWADRAEACRSAARRGSDPSWNRIDPTGASGGFGTPTSSASAS